MYTCTCPDPKCRWHWRVSQVGGWRVLGQDRNWGTIPMTFHPDDENLARWVGSNHGVDANWVAPNHIPNQGGCDV